MLLMIDNYDSFTYNLVQYCLELGAKPEVIRNDQLTLAEIIALNPMQIIISPGPCTPNEAGVSLDVVNHFYKRIPLLGVCLGHQALVQALGGTVIRARAVMHGKTSPVTHDQTGVFAELPSPLTATRYHSLVAREQDLPSELLVNAWVDEADGHRTIMGVQHATYPVAGVQFHPESIMSEHGHAMLANFLRWRPLSEGGAEGVAQGT